MVNDEAKQSVIQFEDVSFQYPGAETEYSAYQPRRKRGRIPCLDWRKWLRKDNSDTIDKRVS